MKRSPATLASAFLLILFACSGCNVHPLGIAVMLAVLRPPIGVVIGAIIAVVWLVIKLSEKD